MGQVFQQDNIPNIVVASGTTVTLSNTNQGSSTKITLGGQQYSLSSALTMDSTTTGAGGLDTGSLGAIQLWYVYAIVNQSSRALALIASQTGPSTGPSMPSGYGTAYLLIGAFYTNGSSQVASMVTITGTATSDWIAYTPTGAWTSNTSYAGKFRRVGDTMEIEGRVDTTGTPTSANFSITIPSGFTINTSKLTDTGSVGSTVGYGRAEHGSTGYVGAVLYSNGSILMQGYATGLFTQAVPISFVNGDHIYLRFVVPISGWNTALL